MSAGGARTVELGGARTVELGGGRSDVGREVARRGASGREL
jgi:hypothetical protein